MLGEGENGELVKNGSSGVGVAVEDRCRGRVGVAVGNRCRI